MKGIPQLNKLEGEVVAVTQPANQELFLVAMGGVAIKHVLWPSERIIMKSGGNTSDSDRWSEIMVVQGGIG